jgi:hypothetical protein
MDFELNNDFERKQYIESKIYFIGSKNNSEESEWVTENKNQWNRFLDSETNIVWMIWSATQIFRLLIQQLYQVLKG